MIDWIEKIGRLGSTVIITLLSLFFTQLITRSIYLFMNQVMPVTGKIASIASPLIIAPFLSWFFIDMLIKIKCLEKEMSQLATYDFLTHLYNRNSFFIALDSLLHHVKRTRTDLTLLFIDIDHFKSINDSHGHAVGDLVLQEFAGILRMNLRENDIIGRIGGEEFLVGLPGLSLENGMKVAEKLRQAVIDHTVSMQNQTPLQITISIGVSVYRHFEEVDSNTLVKNADLAMYAAKHNGRNCVRSISQSEF